VGGIIGCSSIGYTYPITQPIWFLKIEGSNPFVPIGYVGYKLRFKGIKGGMTLYHIGYVEIGKC